MTLVRLALRGIKLAAIVVLLTGLAWLFREPLLRLVARWWVVNESVAHADAIVVLGGGRDWRPFAAAEMYKSGVAPVLLVAQSAVAPSEQTLHLPHDTDVSIAILQSQGIPPANIQRFGTSVTSSREEAAALREWALKNGVKDFAIPTDPFHTRRVRWIFQKEFAGTGLAVHVLAVPHPRYTTEEWWKDEDGFLTFQNELLKSVYYFFRY